MRKLPLVLLNDLLTVFVARIQTPTAYQFYYGNLHAHSGFSDGNQDSISTGKSQPLQDYQFTAASQQFD